MDANFLKIAKQAALEAGKIISRYKEKAFKITIKNNDLANIVTQADIESEDKIVQILTKNFPSHSIIGEENTKIKKESDYVWVIDPIDGTLSFSHGLPFFSVAIGLLKKNKPFLGVVYQVATNQLFWAQQDKGAYLNGKKIRVSKIDHLDKATVVFGWGAVKTRSEKFKKYVQPLMNKVHYPYSVGSGTTGHVFLSRGMIEASFDIGWIWDYAASFVIISEAGGRMTDFEGQELDWNKDRNDRMEVVASNGLVHDKILEALK